MIENFIELNLTESLYELHQDTAPLWGNMSAQHMVEHLSDLLKICNGNNLLEIPQVPEHMFDNMRRFLMGKSEFPKGFKSTLMGENPEPLRFSSITEALAELETERKIFVEYFELNPEKQPFNPTFGKLNQHQWIQFHNKHFTHHLKQFGIEI
jgi:hydroxymethylglutaryl-CoA reductase